MRSRSRSWTLSPVSSPARSPVYPAVRTSVGSGALADRMQWDATPSAGWSTAHPDHFYQPLIDDPAYSPASVNVADQRSDPDSLLNWMRDLISARPTEIGTAPLAFIDTGDPRVIGYTRGTTIVLANFTDEAKSVSHSDGVLVAGDAVVTDRSVTLEPYGWVWLVNPRFY